MRKRLFLIALLVAGVLLLFGCPLAANNHFDKAIEYHSQRNYPEALKEFRRAAELMPWSPLYHYALGAECLELGDRKGAQEQYEVLRRLSSEDAGKLQRKIDRQPQVGKS